MKTIRIRLTKQGQPAKLPPRTRHYPAREGGIIPEAPARAPANVYHNYLKENQLNETHKQVTIALVVYVL